MKIKKNHRPSELINLGELGMWSINTLTAQSEHRTRGVSGHSEWFVPLIDTKYKSLYAEYTEAIDSIKNTKLSLSITMRITGILKLHEFNEQTTRITRANIRLQNLIKQRSKLNADYTTMIDICGTL